MSAGNKIPTDGGAPLGQTPFAGLKAGEAGDRRQEAGRDKLAATSQRVGPKEPSGGVAGPNPACPPPVSGLPPPAKHRGRVDITRQTAGRGGKTVTVVSGFLGIGQAEKEQLAKKMQKACGAGGTVKDGCIEIQGDKREPVAKILTEAGFRPVFAGG